MNGPVVAAVGGVQVDQELGVQAGHLPLQDVGDALALLLLLLPLAAADVGAAAGQSGGLPTRLAVPPPPSRPVPVPDGRPVNGAHGGGEGPVQRVVENGRADVGHDGVQQRLTQVLLLGGHRGGRGLETQTGLFRTPAPSSGPAAPSSGPAAPLNRKEQRRRLTTAMSFFSFSRAISHFCSVFRGHLWTAAPDQARGSEVLRF